MTGDGGAWLREQCIILARMDHTSVFEWLALPLEELGAWIEAHNTLEHKLREGKENGR